MTNEKKVATVMHIDGRTRIIKPQFYGPRASAQWWAGLLPPPELPASSDGPFLSSEVIERQGLRAGSRLVWNSANGTYGQNFHSRVRRPRTGA